MDTSNCYGVAYLAEKYDSISMQEIAQRFAVNNFRALSNSPEFNEIKCEQVLSLISQNHLNVMNESEVNLLFNCYSYLYQPESQEATCR